jgi:hypothetical protein
MIHIEKRRTLFIHLKQQKLTNLPVQQSSSEWKWQIIVYNQHFELVDI